MNKVQLFNTPLETHAINGVPILVKREDLCAPYPGPSFSKIRGVAAHIAARPEKVIGVLDTLHSKGGWAVAYCCAALGKKAVDFWPRFKRDRDNPVDPPRRAQQECEKLGATLYALPAGRSAILYHQAKKVLAGWGDSYMMPNALKLPESITENAAEVERTEGLPDAGTLVISISSGTVASGVLLGMERRGLLDRYRVVLHMGYSRSQDATLEYMEKMSGLKLAGRVMFVDEGYGYADAAPREAVSPFPANPHYDLKAWHWLADPFNLAQFASRPIVFWSIGD